MKWYLKWETQRKFLIARDFNPFQSNFSANCILPSFYWFWAVKRLVITCNYTTVLKKKNTEKRKEYNLRYLLAKFRTTWKNRRTGSDSGRTNATKTVSDVFRHRSGTGKAYCRTRFDVGSKRVKSRTGGKIITWL
jgi:hypothetical protein